MYTELNIEKFEARPTIFIKGSVKKQWQHSEECMCRLRNIAMRDYQESVTTEQTDAGQSDPYVPLCVAGDTIKS